ncbi:adenosylcobinamide-GDP ribazoletransferase [Vibrio algarum]|uniref:Adenosylcobinamide-GDP ribazoletransferase n=1 Tax=Vibrio algarum TaxID=3020714 RepID=A0ABT4YU66_9VIBR|nr:adenosylcobinamide-GDP ribazoletransferase [Vibrio sp. KJ40-1]MDB1125122.1 adenosylcobinamide-GDP ribazoletransferase [Vibrio sp. KJ40-1]
MKDKLIRELQVFLLAISIFTRIPVSASVPYSEARKNESYKYGGLVGLVIGGLTALVYMIAASIWPTEVAVVISMAFSVYATGAFHEDGFADTCDGFGGGFTPERKLEIMKDSRVGAYALLAVVLILLLKYTTLVSLEQIPLALVIAHVLSRSMAISFIYTHGYVRQTEQSKLKIAKSPSSKYDFLTMIIIAGLMTLFIPTFKLAFVLIATLLLARIWFSRWMIKQVGGYTGDALGAIQQISEVLCYLVFLAV